MEERNRKLIQRKKWFKRKKAEKKGTYFNERIKKKDTKTFKERKNEFKTKREN